MASKFPGEREETVQLRARKGHDMTWSCDKHSEPIKFYCKDHTIPICLPCAMKDHVKKQCELQDIEDVILEMRNKLEDTQTNIAATTKHLKAIDTKSKETSASNHLQSVNNEVNATYDKMLKDLKDSERDEIRLITEEADEEIRIINEKKERRIKVCKEETEKQQQISKDIQAKLLSEINKIDMVVRKKFEDLKSKNQHELNTMDNLDSKIERIKQNDKTLVTEAPQIIAALDESLKSNVHQEVAGDLDRIEREVQKVKFVKGEVGGKHYERIAGYIGKWELVKSIDIALIVSEPRVRGFMSDDEIVLDSKDNGLYFSNIGTEHTEKAIAGEPNIWFTSCAPIDRNVIVCGKKRRGCMGDSLDRCITLYDRQWKVIRDIPIPRNTSLSSTVYVDVARNGMILAAQYGQSNIYFINPADGKIVNTIIMQDKEMYGAIQALSSGDIVVQTDEKVFTVISRLGEENAVVRCDEWTDSWCYVDKRTDTLYITYEDEERNVYIVDQMSCDGNIQARRILEYKLSYHSDYDSPCFVTPAGNLVVCDGEKLLVYKKSFIV